MEEKFTRHIPQLDIRGFEDISFEHALSVSNEGSAEYDSSVWLFVPDHYT